MLFQELPDVEGFLQFHSSKFIQFPKLPAELRIMIWDAAIESIPTQIDLHVHEHEHDGKAALFREP